MSAAQPGTLTTMTADSPGGAFLSLHFGVNFSRGDASTLCPGGLQASQEPSRRVGLGTSLSRVWSSPDLHFRLSTVSQPVAVFDSPNSTASLDPLPPKKPACLCNSLLPSNSSKGCSVQLLRPAVNGSMYLLPSPLLALASLAAKSANTETRKSTVIALHPPGARSVLLAILMW